MNKRKLISDSEIKEIFIKALYCSQTPLITDKSKSDVHAQRAQDIAWEVVTPEVILALIKVIGNFQERQVLFNVGNEYLAFSSQISSLIEDSEIDPSANEFLKALKLSPDNKSFVELVARTVNTLCLQNRKLGDAVAKASALKSINTIEMKGTKNDK